MGKISAKERLDLMDETYVNISQVAKIYGYGMRMAAAMVDDVYEQAIVNRLWLPNNKKSKYVPTELLFKMCPIDRAGIVRMYKREMQEKNNA